LNILKGFGFGNRSMESTISEDSSETIQHVDHFKGGVETVYDLATKIQLPFSCLSRASAC
jgi:hypothetical protein